MKKRAIHTLLLAGLMITFAQAARAQEDRPVRYFPTDPTSPCSVITPLINNWVLGRVWQCVGTSGVNNGHWVQIQGGGGGGGVWGTITGTLSNQTDLQAALNARLLATNNLSDLTSAATARANLNLGTIATKAQTIGSAPQKGDGSGGLVAASSPDIVSLFSGCSGTLLLSADGTCHSSASAINQLTGDVTAGPGSGSVVATLANTAVTPGAYGDSTHVGAFNVDAKGRIIAASNVSISGGGGGCGTAGNGINITGGCQILVDPNVTSTFPVVQANTALFCNSTSGNTTYTCTLNPVSAGAYVAGQCLTLIADMSNTTTATLNVDTRGALPILTSAGAALSASAIVATHPVTLCADATAANWNIQGGSGGGSGATTLTKQTLFVTGFNYSGTASAEASQVIYCHDFPLFAPASFSRVTSGINTGGTTSSVWGAALYDWNGNRLTGATSTGAAADVGDSAPHTVSLSGATVLTPGTTGSPSAAGMYTLCMTNNGASPATFWGEPAGLSYFAATADPVIYTAANASSISGSTITWPSTLGAKTRYPGGGQFPFAMLNY